MAIHKKQIPTLSLIFQTFHAINFIAYITIATVIALFMTCNLTAISFPSLKSFKPFKRQTHQTRETTKQTRACSSSTNKSCVTTQDSTTKKYSIRPDGFNRARYMAGSTGFLYQYKVGDAYGWSSGTVDSRVTRHPETMSVALFGQDLITPVLADTVTPTTTTIDERELRIEGSNIQGSDRNAKAWLADYFYLPRDYQGSITITPRIQTSLIDFNFYAGLDGLTSGVFFRAQLPFVNTQWDLQLVETIDNTGTAAHPAGYFSVGEMPRSLLLDSFSEYANGVAPTQSLNAPDSGIIFQPLNQARLGVGSVNKSAASNLRLEAGYNAYHTERAYMALFLTSALPTLDAAASSTTFLWSPIIGNEGHWELGGGISMGSIIWSNATGENHFGIAIDAVASYRLQNGENRTFDLKGKPNSCYMLAAKFGPNGGTSALPLLIGGENLALMCPASVQNPQQQFALEYAPVANISTVRVQVGKDTNVDFVVMANVTMGSVSIDVGYNFWMNTGASIAISDDGPLFGLTDPEQQNTWALKGDARMFGFVDNGGMAPDAPIALSATESKATIRNGTNKVTLDFSATDINPSIDNPLPSILIDDPQTCLPKAVNNKINPGGIQINTSVKPSFLTIDSLDFTTIKGRSNTLFAYIGTASYCKNFIANGGIGLFYEKGSNPSTTSNPNKDSSSKGCKNTSHQLASPTFWGVWVKVGASFN